MCDYIACVCCGRTHRRDHGCDGVSRIQRTHELCDAIDKWEARSRVMAMAIKEAGIPLERGTELEKAVWISLLDLTVIEDPEMPDDEIRIGSVVDGRPRMVKVVNVGRG